MRQTTRDLPSTYREAEARLHGKVERTICNNTQLVRIDAHTIGMRLHHTIIVEFYDNDVIWAGLRGWNTVTTRQRINQVIRSHGHNVCTRNYVAFFDNVEADEIYFRGATVLHDYRHEPALQQVGIWS